MSSLSVASNSWVAKARSLARCLARYELVCLAAAAPFLLFPGRWTPLGFAILVLVWLSRWAATGKLSRPTPLDWPIVVLLLMTAVSLAASVSPNRSWLRVPVIILGVATYYGLVNALGEEKHLRWLALGLILAGLGYAMVGLLGTDWSFLRFVNLPGLYERIPTIIRYAAPGAEGLEFLNPRQVAGGLVVFLPIPLALSIFGRGRGMRCFAGLAAVVMSGMLLLTESIPGVVALGVTLCLLALWRNRWFLVPIFVGLVLLLAGILVYGPRELAALFLSQDNPIGIAVVLRLDIWSRALAMIHDMPLTGIGLDAYRLMQWQFYPGFLLGPEYHAHNLYLQTALDLGVPGLVAFLWLLATFGGMVLRGYRITVDPEQRTFLGGAALSVLAHAVYGLMDMNPWGSRTQVAFWAVLGAAAATFFLAKQVDDQPGRPQHRGGAKRVVAFALAGILAVLLILTATGFFTVNFAMVQAHRTLLTTREAIAPDREMLRSVAGSLTRALDRQPSNTHLYSLLGEVYGWLGDDEQAIAAFRRRVELDGSDPTARYDPAGSILQRIQGDRRYDEVRVYQHWTSRFPERAEFYLLVAIYSCEHSANQTMALHALEKGLIDAQPNGALAFYHAQVHEAGCHLGRQEPRAQDGSRIGAAVNGIPNHR